MSLLRLAALVFCAALPASPTEAAPLVRKGIPYGREASQVFDVYAPSQARGAAVIMMVGPASAPPDEAGGTIGDDRIAHWLARGFVYISVGYRRHPELSPLDRTRDLGRALAAAQGYAEKWGADRNRFILVGHEEGAQLIALLATAPSLAGEQGATPWLGNILLAGSNYELPEPPAGRRAETGEHPSSPALPFPAAGIPLLAVCSELRGETCPAARRFVAKARLFGAQATLLATDLSPTDIYQRLGEESRYTRAVDAFLRGLDKNIAQPLD